MTRPKMAGYRMGHGSTLLEESIIYDPTYLSDDDDGQVNATLFVTHGVRYLTRAGNERTGSKRAVIRFDTADEMVEWIETVGAAESESDATR